MVLKNSYSKWCARNMLFLMFMLHSHVVSTSNDRGLFVHEALRSFRTRGHAHARTSQSMKVNGDTGLRGEMNSSGKPRHTQDDTDD